MTHWQELFFGGAALVAIYFLIGIDAKLGDMRKIAAREADRRNIT